jgi:hypothetical protein
MRAPIYEFLYRTSIIRAETLGLAAMLDRAASFDAAHGRQFAKLVPMSANGPMMARLLHRSEYFSGNL